MGAKPPGIEGKHWASQIIEITDGSEVEITVVNETINAGQHNTTGILLTIDDVVVANPTAEAGTLTVNHSLSGAGRHEITARCYNEHAEAGSCTIAVTKRPIERF